MARVEGQRVAGIQLDAQRPTVALIAKPVADDPARRLPLLGELLPARRRACSVYASEPRRSLYGLRAGARFGCRCPMVGASAPSCVPCGATTRASTARVALDAADYRSA